MDENELPSDELSEAMLEALQAASKSYTDPYDSYVNRIKVGIYKNCHDVSSRVKQGYKVLLETIEKK